MSDLPSREHINKRIGGLAAGRLVDEWAIAGAYGLGELKTEAEWREAINYEAAADVWADRADWSGYSAIEAATDAVVAAIGDTE